MSFHGFFDLTLQQMKNGKQLLLALFLCPFLMGVEFNGGVVIPFCKGNWHYFSFLFFPA
jgi:hypothetical protein